MLNRQLTKAVFPSFQNGDEAFFVMNLGYFVEAAIEWKHLLPRVHPFFAFKANNDPVLTYLMMKLNFGFDCASLVSVTESHNNLYIDEGKSDQP